MQTEKALATSATVLLTIALVAALTVILSPLFCPLAAYVFLR